MSADALLRYFDSLCEVADSPKKLRELGVALAVRGRLTSQRASQDASDVLETARRERNAASKLHRGKRPKPLLPIEEFEFPFPVPSRWVKCWSGDLLTFVTSGSRGWAKYYSTTGPIFLRIGNLDYQTVRLDLSNIQRVTPPSTAEGRRTRVQPGDILVSITGDTGMVGLIPSDQGEAYINQHIALARPAKAITPEYLAWYLTSPFALSRFWDFQRGIKNSLGLDDIRSIPVALPPLEEQTEITQQIQRWYALCDELEAKQEKKRQARTRLNEACLDRLLTAQTPDEFAEHWQRIHDNFDLLYDSVGEVEALRAILPSIAARGLLGTASIQKSASQAYLEACVPDPPKKLTKKFDPKPTPLFDVPDHWCWVPFGRLIASINNGLYKPSKYYTEDGPACVRMYNIQDGELDLTKLQRLELTEDEKSKYELQTGDLVVNRVNSAELVGKAALVRKLAEPMVFEAMNMRVRLLSGGALPEYIAMYLTSVEVRAAFQGAGKQAIGQASISQPQVLNLPVPLPPPDEQSRILAVLCSLREECSALKAKLQRRDELASDLLAAIVAQVAHEEPVAYPEAPDIRQAGPG